MNYYLTFINGGYYRFLCGHLVSVPRRVPPTLTPLTASVLSLFPLARFSLAHEAAL